MKKERNTVIGLFGKPASGKSMLLEAIKRQLTGWFGIPDEDIFSFSVGELLREEVKNKTPLGLRYAGRLEKGLLLPQEEVDPYVLSYLRAHPSSITIIDGYPRGRESVIYMQEKLPGFSLAFAKSTIPDHIAIERMSAQNEAPEIIRRRMNEYHEMSSSAWNEIAMAAPENHYVVDGQINFDYNIRTMLRHILINRLEH